METSMECLRFDTSETDLGVDLLLVKKKIKTIKIAVVLMFASIILIAVFNILTVLMSSEENNGISDKSNRTENNAIEEEIRTLNESNNDALHRISNISENNAILNTKIGEISSNISETNSRANEMEKMTNQKYDEILERTKKISSNISETNLHAIETEIRILNKKIEEISSNIAEKNLRANEMEKMTSQKFDEILERTKKMSSNISETNLHAIETEIRILNKKIEEISSNIAETNGRANEIEEMTNQKFGEILERTNKMSNISEINLRATEKEIRILNKKIEEISSNIAETNGRANEIEEMTNQKFGEILERTNKMSNISETNLRTTEKEIRILNESIKGISSIISETNRRANEMEIRMNESNKEFHGIFRKMSSNILETNNRANKLDSRNDEIYKKIEKMSSAISELQFNLEKKNSVYSLVQKGFCLDTIHGTSNSSLELYPCHNHGHNQEWQFTGDDELKNRKSCLTFTNNTSSSTVQVIFNECNGSASQKLKFISGSLRSTAYDACVQTEGRVVFAAKCISTISTQKFERKLLYTIDQVCTFKQGSYVLLNAKEMVVAHNGFLVHDAQCLNLSLSWQYCVENYNYQKFKYTDDGQIKNELDNVCVEKRNNGTVTMNKCDSSSESQKWICDHESV